MINLQIKFSQRVLINIDYISIVYIAKKKECKSCKLKVTKCLVFVRRFIYWYRKVLRTKKNRIYKQDKIKTYDKKSSALAYLYIKKMIKKKSALETLLKFAIEDLKEVSKLGSWKKESVVTKRKGDKHTQDNIG